MRLITLLTAKVAAITLMLVLLGGFPAFGSGSASGESSVSGASGEEISGDLDYTLSRALDRALKKNKYIKSAAADARSAKAGKKRALGALLPHAYATMTTSHLQATRSKERYTDYVNQNTNYQNVGIRQVLFDMPSFSRYQSAGLQAERADIYLQRAKLEILYTTEKEYFAYLSAVENVKSYKKSVERMTKQLESANAFYERQMKPRLHVLQMQTQLAKAESQLSEAENKVETQKAKLISILALPQHCAIKFMGDLAKTHVQKLDALKEYVKKAFKGRPDVRIRRKDVSISEKNENAVLGQFFPEVDVSADYFQRGYDYEEYYDDRNHEYCSVGINLRWDFFDGGSTYYGLKEQKEKTRSAELTLRKLLEDVVAEVKENYLDVMQLEKQITLAKAYVNEAQETYDRADKRYKLGIGTSTEVVDASKELIEAEVYLNTTLSDYNSSLAELYSSTGEIDALIRIAKN